MDEAIKLHKALTSIAFLANALYPMEKLDMIVKKQQALYSEYLKYNEPHNIDMFRIRVNHKNGHWIYNVFNEEL